MFLGGWLIRIWRIYIEGLVNSTKWLKSKSKVNQLLQKQKDWCSSLMIIIRGHQVLRWTWTPSRGSNGSWIWWISHKRTTWGLVEMRWCWHLEITVTMVFGLMPSSLDLKKKKKRKKKKFLKNHNLAISIMYMFDVFIHDDTGFFCALIISSMYLK